MGSGELRPEPLELTALAESKGVSLSQLALARRPAKKGYIVPITESRNADRVAQDVAARASRPSLIQAQGIAVRIGVDADRVRVVNPYVGGGFGSKAPTWSEPVLAAAAVRDLKRPVKLVPTREGVRPHRPPLGPHPACAARRLGRRHTEGGRARVRRGELRRRRMADAPRPGRLAPPAQAENLAIDQRLVEVDVPPACAMRGPR
ncbi:molybdopterin cofactor-binding domain-containing protein [Streptomyces sp. NPDC002588]|uniref:molybdopterin cofactor-binding domain-containing protein n=1 Tax=Streptomyces sp. NPDC002588 TaxID=3154419 RepID=UPI0033255053